jgi:hypothetical protein
MSKEYITGLSIAEEPSSLVQAITLMINDYTLFKTKAQAAKSKFLAFHSVQNFKKVIGIN